MNGPERRDPRPGAEAAGGRAYEDPWPGTGGRAPRAWGASDAPSLLSDRIRSLVAAGVEVAVATDHNAVTDYRPTNPELGQTGRAGTRDSNISRAVNLLHMVVKRRD